MEVVEREIRVPAAPEKVYSLMMDPARFVLWMGRRVEIDPRPGGAIRIEVNQRNVMRGAMGEVEPFRKLVFMGLGEQRRGPTGVEPCRDVPRR